MPDRVDLILSLGVLLALWASAASASALGPRNVTLSSGRPRLVRLPSNATAALAVNLTSTLFPVPNDTAFWVIEAHTQRNPLKMSSNDSFAWGAHLGLVVPFSSSNSSVNVTFLANLTNPGPDETSAVLLARPYSSQAPVPGICRPKEDKTNSSTHLDYRPAPALFYDSSTTHLTIHNCGLLGTPGLSCDSQQNVEYAVYRRFLDHRNLNEDYFLTELAETMLLAEDIQRKGDRVDQDFVRQPDGERLNKVVFASYPQSAAIFAVVATVTYPTLFREEGGERERFGAGVNSSSVVYITTATYGCVLEGDDDAVPGMRCGVNWNWIEVMAMTLAVMVSLWLLLLGRHFFALTHAAYGFMAGGFAGCVAAEAMAGAGFAASFPFKVFLFVALGSVGGVLWLSQWLLLGLPRVSLLLPGLLAGSVPAGALLFSPALNTETFSSDAAFWSTAFAISAGLALPLVLFPRQASVACSVLLGGALLALALDYAVTGGVLKYYLVVNFVRRAAGADGGDFSWAVTGIPLQASDFELMAFVLFVVLASGTLQSVFAEDDFPNNDVRSLVPSPLLPSLNALCSRGRRGVRLRRRRSRRGGRGQESPPSPSNSAVIAAEDELEPLLPAPHRSDPEHNAAIRAALHALIDARYPIVEERPLSPGEQERQQQQQREQERRQASAPPGECDGEASAASASSQSAGPHLGASSSSCQPSAPPESVASGQDQDPFCLPPASYQQPQPSSTSRLRNLFGSSVADGVLDPDVVRRARTDPFKPPSPPSSSSAQQQSLGSQPRGGGGGGQPDNDPPPYEGGFR